MPTRKEPKYRIFILSPARVAGKRTDILLSDRATFDLANRVRSGGAPLGEVFTFLSGLYFRGKLTYAFKFARSYRKIPGVLIITTNRGLLSAETIVTTQDLRSFGEVEIDPAEKRYVQALHMSATKLAEKLPQDSDVVLLGSIGTKKYAELLTKIFGKRLKFPVDFVGRGDMSRGGLLLRSADSGEELEYVPISGAVRHGKRPPKLEPRRWIIR